MVSKFLIGIAKRIRQVGAALGEKSKSSVDEHELEHFLLYHGLVGSSPDNQRSFKDVRADVRIAVQERNSLKMGIALNLPPLWWDEKLKTIMSEIVAEEKDIRPLQALLPEMTDDAWPNRFDPLGRPEWHVRSNAASLLAFINARVAASRMIRALHASTSGGESPAFPHVAYALGRLGADEAIPALEQYLTSDQPWFRVDAAGALAHWPVPVVGEKLMSGMLAFHNLSDYMAVAIAKRHRPIEFFESTHPSAAAGACAMVLGLIEASNGTFNSDIIAECGVSECADKLLLVAKSNPTPLTLRAALAVSNLEIGLPVTEELRQVAGDENARKIVVERLKSAAAGVSANLDTSAEIRSAVLLAGALGVKDIVPELVKMLEQDPPYVDDIVDALGAIGDKDATQPLIELANRMVKMPERTGLPLSKTPVADENRGSSKTYWHVLKALGQTGSAAAAEYLDRAIDDYAPDKREQAFQSLLSLCDKNSSPINISNAIGKALEDPAPQVRVIGLEGVSSLNRVDALPEVIKLTESAEVSVSRKAFSTLSDLWAGGHKKAVSEALGGAIAAHSGGFRKDQLISFLEAQKQGKN